MITLFPHHLPEWFSAMFFFFIPLQTVINPGAFVKMSSKKLLADDIRRFKILHLG